jgi:uncharacterized protein (TIGR00290 family)
LFAVNKIPAYFNWSGGKDSALALYTVLQEGIYDVKALVTTVNSEYQRISMHGVRRELLHEQAKQIGIPLCEILLPDSPDMESYETAMNAGIQPLLQQGIRHCIFGDIFLEDLRAYRENKLREIEVTGIFPLWKRDTTELVRSFIDLGFKTIVVCTQADKLDESFAGRVIDISFLNDLPETVDPCGENGEFHTFVFDGPIFHQPVEFTKGENIYRTYGDSEREWGFHYTDLLEIQ